MKSRKPADSIRQRLDAIRSAGGNRQPRVVDILPGGRCRMNGQELINFGSNDYLGLAHRVNPDPLLIADGQFGATASALVSGRSTYHAELERALARFEHSDAVLLFPTGYAANLGVLCGLIEEGDAVFCDRENHASIVDAARLCPGQLLVYRRDRLGRLVESLQRRRADYKHVVIVTDGVFSMDGTVAPLSELCAIAERFDASVIVDEAHGTGVLGDTGRGTCEHFHVENRVLARVGTMSKAMGGMGGFVAGSQDLIDLLRNTARPQFFSTALPPLVCRAMHAAVNRMSVAGDERKHLVELRTRLTELLENHGLATIPTGVAPIIPVIVPGNNAVVELSKRLEQRGFFVPAIRSPTVRVGTERLRLSLSCDHSQEDIAAVVEAIHKSR